MTNDETRTMRESLFSEILMSLIIALSIQSCLMIIRGFNEFVTITTYPQLIPLILPVIHTVIRRKWPNLLPCFILHIVSAVLFFLALAFIPASEFAYNLSNRVYLGVTVFFFTVSSYSYRLNPKIQPSDTQVAAIPACVFPITGFFYVMMNRPAILANLISNTILCAVLYLVMRQVAVFDTKYYHSIRNSSQPQVLLKKQNYRTAAGLVGIFAISLLILKVIPIESLTKIVLAGIQTLFRLLIPAILAFLDFLGSLLKGVTSEQESAEEELMPDELLPDAPWVHVLSTIIAIIILMGLIFLVINTIRLIIQNAPRYAKEKKQTDDGIVTDTIENIGPDKRSFFRKRHDFGKGYERRIRKQFYEKTMSAMRKGLPVTAASTPGQIESVLIENGDSDFPALKKEYEKVRYGK
ncbi:MAG: hypothetical protein J5777_06810 [Clostridiales bacterium]|nr:hypothetical protein [Clostridiales bacterium]